MKKALISAVVSVNCASVAFVPFSTFAQDNSVTDTQNVSQAQGEQETMVVTGRYTATEQVSSATGLDLSDLETPQSVSVITEQRIKDQNLNNVKEVVDATVGLSVNPADTERNTFVSRGFTVGSYQIDSVPQSLGDLGGALGETLIDLATYERVEIVRGATGLMTGSGSPAAAINFVRKKADSADFTGYVEAKTGSWDKREVSTDLGGAVNDSGTVRARIVAKYNKNNSYMDRYSKESTVLYGVIDSDISDDTLLRIGAGMQNNNAPGATWGSLTSYYSDGTKIDWSRSSSTAADWSYYNTDAKYYFANLEHYFANNWQWKLNYNHNEYEQNSKLLYLYGTVDKSDEGASLLVYDLASRSQATVDSVDTQLNGDFDWLGQHHEFVTGAIYSQQNRKSYYGYGSKTGGTFDQSLLDYDGGFAESTWNAKTLNADYDTKELGLYAAARFGITDDLKWIVGSRISNWQREGLYDTAGSNVDYSEHGVLTPYTGLLYDLTEQHRVYASYAEIFQPQYYRKANGEFFEPLTGRNYEIGLKSALLNDTVHTSVAVYRIEQDNQAEATSEVLSNGDTIYKEVDGVVSKGFELEANGQVTEGLKISAGYSQYDAKDKNGDDVNTVYPKKQLKVFTTYNFFSALPKLTIGGGVKWQSKIYADDTSGYRTQQDDYVLVDLMTRYDITPQTQVQLNVNNVFDEKYYQTVCADCYMYGAPANFTLSVQHNF